VVSRTGGEGVRDFHGDRLRELRQAAGATQKEIADFVGVSAGQISCWETGAVKPPVDRIEALVDFFVIPLDHFSSEPPQSVPQHVIESGKRNGKRYLPEPQKLIKPPDPPDPNLAISRVLGISLEELEKIEKHFTGVQKAVEYSRLIKAQIENLRQFQNTIDSFIGKVNERFLELEDLRKRAVKLSEEVGKDSEDIEFQFLNVKASG
jgi:transcriptional regulator with XRE-family HTH domain